MVECSVIHGHFYHPSKAKRREQEIGEGFRYLPWDIRGSSWFLAEGSRSSVVELLLSCLCLRHAKNNVCQALVRNHNNIIGWLKIKTWKQKGDKLGKRRWCAGVGGGPRGWLGKYDQYILHMHIKISWWNLLLCIINIR